MRARRARAGSDQTVDLGARLAHHQRPVPPRALVVPWLCTRGIQGTRAMWFRAHPGWLAAHITVVAPPLMALADARPRNDNRRRSACRS